MPLPPAFAAAIHTEVNAMLHPSMPVQPTFLPKQTQVLHIIARRHTCANLCAGCLKFGSLCCEGRRSSTLLLSVLRPRQLCCNQPPLLRFKACPFWPSIPMSPRLLPPPWLTWYTPVLLPSFTVVSAKHGAMFWLVLSALKPTPTPAAANSLNLTLSIGVGTCSKSVPGSNKPIPYVIVVIPCVVVCKPEIPASPP